jgi:hypothetical protein
MGMFDTIRCEAPLPDGYTVPDRSFQTKTLCCVADNFTITTQGRLVLHHCRFESSSAKGNRGLLVPSPLDAIDTEYHGDIEMCGFDADKKLIRFAARFTHGDLEWIRPLDELDELHRILLTNRP